MSAVKLEDARRVISASPRFCSNRCMADHSVGYATATLKRADQQEED
jgi:hypothetical protein